jgi:LysM repeat protein
MSDTYASESAGHGPGAANLVIIALAAVAIVVGAVALVAGLNARKATDALKAELAAQSGKIDTADQNLRNLTGQTERLFSQVGQQLNLIGERMNAMAGKLATLTPAPKPVVAGLLPAGAAPVAGAQQATAAGAAASSGKTHAIAAGDNFGKIAKKYGISVAALEKANSDVNPSKLKIGQKIRLP